MKIGLPKEFFERDLPNYVESSTKEAIATFKDLGAEICEISLH